MRKPDETCSLLVEKGYLCGSSEEEHNHGNDDEKNTNITLVSLAGSKKTLAWFSSEKVSETTSLSLIKIKSYY